MKKFLLLLCLIVGFGVAMAQNTKVSGVVVDESGEPIPGVSVSVKGTSQGTYTTENGTFQLNVSSASAVLSFKYLGMKDQDVPAKPGSMKIVMQNDEQALEEVVVTVAYGQSKKVALTGAVTSVDAKVIEKRPVTSVAAVLEGTLGVQVNNTYGQPGSDPAIRIRGFTTINGTNSPLYVLDGVPFGGNISDLNPQDIESMSVLKDAASAALYGTKASNGVILITTKKSRNEGLNIRLNINQGIFERGLKDYDRLNANEFMEAMWMGYRNNLMTSLPKDYPTKELANAKTNASLVSDQLRYNIYNKANNELFDANGKLFADAKIRDGYAGDLDWYEPMERKGYRQEYSISGDGSTAKANYLFSASYLDEQGYFKNSGFERFTGRSKVELTPKKWFTTGFSLSGSYQVTNRSNGDSSDSFTNPFMFCRDIAPIYPIHLHDMTTGNYIMDGTGNKQYDAGSLYARPQFLARHVVWENELNMDRGYRNTLDGLLYATVTFLKDFKFTVKGDLNNRTSEQQIYENAKIGDGSGNNGRAGRESYRYKEYTFQQQLTWGRTFNESHYVDVIAGHENWAWERNYTYLRKANEVFPGKTDLINFKVLTSIDGYQDNLKSESYFVRGRYNYNEKYFADASFRRDGSSRFHPDHRWGNFWSAGGNWIISKEDFMLGLKDKINFMKLRAAYGEVGNDGGVGYYGYMALYSMSQNSNMGALYKSQNEATNIKWEAATSFGVALEGRLLNRLDFSLEYFDKRSRDLLFDVNLPLSAGATSSSSAVATLTKNIGSIANRGVEIGLNYDIVNDKNLKWSVGLDVTSYKNEILSLPDENKENGIIDGTKKYMIGHGMYDYWMYQYVGVDQMTGNCLYKPNYDNYYIGTPVEGKTALPSQYVVQVNGVNYTTYTTYAERNWSGSAIPDATGSFNTALRWKNFNMGVLFTYGIGGKIIDYTYQGLMSMSGSPSAMHKDILNSWSDVPAGMTETSPNRIDPNGTPVIDYARSQYNNSTSTRFLQDASYLVLKNINLGYSLPKSLVNKMDINGLTINLTVENLVTFTSLQGMNPQQSFNGTNYNYMVTPRVYSLGLNVQF